MTDVREAIAEWLEAERVCAANALRAKGLRSRIPIEADVATIDRADGSIGSGIERREVNPLTVLEVAWSVRARTRPAAPAAALIAQFGRRCWVAGLLSRHDFDAEPAAWLEEAVLERFVDDYLRSLPDLDVPHPDLAGAAGESLIEFLRSDSVMSHEDVALEGLDVEAPISVRGATLRPLTRDELGMLHSTELSSHMLRSRRPAMPGMERVMLEVHEARPKAEQRRITTRVIRVILGLQLLGFSPAGAGLLRQRDRPVSTGTLSLPLILPQHAAVMVCTPEEFAHAVELADRVPPTIGQPRTPHEVALHRFQQGCAGRTATDAIVDFVIALEAVLLPRESTGEVRFQGEVRFRFALHGARLIGRGGDLEHRKALRRQLTEIYDMRSTIVHGGSLQGSRLAELSPVARRLATEVLLRGLGSGWPTAASFADLVLE